MSILNKPKKPRKSPKAVDNSCSWKERYAAAHMKWYETAYPSAWHDGHYSKPNFPKVSTHGGLETAICEYMKFIGGIGVGTATMGVPIFTKDARGNNVLKGYRPGKGKGKSDTDLTYKGHNLKAEVKVGRDVQRDKQQQYQQRIEQAGGKYMIVRDIQQIYDWVDWVDSLVLF